MVVLKYPSRMVRVMQTANNVLVFPTRNQTRVSQPSSIEEVNANMEMIRQHHIHETLTTVAPKIFEILEIAGFDLMNEEMEKDIKNGAFMVEALRSLLCKYYNMNHPFQDIAENVFVEDGEGGYTIADTLVLELKKGNSVS
jgi:hypothetical protein